MNMVHGPYLSINQMFLNVFDTLFLKDLEMFSVVLWGVWNHRNSVVWNNNYKSHAQMVNDASSNIFQWQQAQLKQDRQGPCFNREGLLLWKTPQSG